MNVRVASPADADAVAAMEVEAFGADAWSATLVTQGVSGELPTVTCLVADVDGALAAYAVTSVAGDIADLQRIGVRPAHRRTGLARELLAQVLAVAARGGAERLLLEVREDNAAALALYAAEGFTELDRRPRYYRDQATAVVLARPVGRMVP